VSAKPHGLLAEFADAEQLHGAALRAKREGYLFIEAYSPYVIYGLAEELHPRKVHVPFWTLVGGVLGGGIMYFVEWYSAAIDYPINVGGRPLFSWPAFFPPTFEMTLLWAAVFGVFAMLIGNGLPRLHHPLFAIPEFERGSSDRFFLLLRAHDPLFDLPRTRDFLATLAPLSIIEVPE
jgi:hypothetical protein